MNLKYNLEESWTKNDLVIMARLINYKIESFNGKWGPSMVVRNSNPWISSYINE